MGQSPYGTVKKLTNLLYEFWTGKLEESTQDLLELNTTLKSKCTPDEHTHVMDLLADSKQEYINEINSRNAKKIQTTKKVASPETETS